MLSRWMSVICCVLLTSLAVSGAARPTKHTVRKGDTLTSIAKRYDVELEQLRRWNHVPGDKIKPGYTISLRPATRSYRVRKGETLGRIAKREATTIDKIVDLNPGLDPRNLRAGSRIELPGADPKAKRDTSKRDDEKVAKGTHQTKSKGACPGRLARVPRHIAYKRVHRDAAFATAQVNDALDRGFDYVLARHRLAPRVHLLDASRRDLGPVGHHRSHQSGRDVDIAYYQKICERDGCPMKKVAPKLLDVRRQWTLLHYWLRRGDVEMIFIDHNLQAELYDYARKHGVSKSKLEKWFQYPRRPGTKEGVIRHWGGHRNHLHVRFRSPAAKRRCKQ